MRFVAWTKFLLLLLPSTFEKQFFKVLMVGRHSFLEKMKFMSVTKNFLLNPQREGPETCR